mmetsp:Transcript_16005/g.36655  ORF Transcript_16005/g.36655 Transcript_16005/m.36655 type:complete len:609 (+) Transcript_16005:94-1920(+)
MRRWRSGIALLSAVIACRSTTCLAITQVEVAATGTTRHAVEDEWLNTAAPRSRAEQGPLAALIDDAASRRAGAHAEDADAIGALPWIRREVVTSLQLSATEDVILALFGFLLFAGFLYLYLSRPDPKPVKMPRPLLKADPVLSPSSARQSAVGAIAAFRRKSMESVSSLQSASQWSVQDLPASVSPIWLKLPAEETLVSVGPTYHVNMRNSLGECLARRGLRPARKGATSLVAMYGGPPPDRQRGILEMCFRDTLSNKRTLAQHLVATSLTSYAPATFLSPAALRARLPPRAGTEGTAGSGRPTLTEDIRDGLWFLKHAGRDNNTHVTCYVGAEDLLSHWESLAQEEGNKHVAQAEVSRPLLHRKPVEGQRRDRMDSRSEESSEPAEGGETETADGHKVTIRAYVLLLEGGRCFIHRELLLKVHAESYSVNDASLEKHVLCHCKHQGVVALRGSTWSQYEAVWPRIYEMMAATFGAFDHEIMKSRKLELDTDNVVPETWQSMFFGRDPVDALQYTLLGVDLIVDRELRPWLIEINTSPNLAPELKDVTGSKIKAEVVEDFCQLVVDPLLRATAEASMEHSRELAWKRLHKWSRHGAASTSSGLGFVEM